MPGFNPISSTPVSALTSFAQVQVQYPANNLWLSVRVEALYASSLRTITSNLLQTTLRPAEAAPFSQEDWQLPQRLPLPVTLRTWVVGYLQTTLLGQDRLPVGDAITDRPAVPPHYRSITEKYNPNLIGQDRFPPGTELLARPPVPPWYRSWEQNLLQSSLFIAGQRPHAQHHWPLTPAQRFAVNLQTWVEKYNPNLIGQDRLPVGEIYSDRPPVPPWLRSWTLNLLQSTLFFVGLKPHAQHHWPLTPAHLFAAHLRTWAEKYNPNLIGRDFLPPGAELLARPPVPPYYRSQEQNLLLSTLYNPQPHSQHHWPLTPARLFASHLRTWAEKYNPNLIGRDRLPTGEIYSDRPPVPPWYRDLRLNLLQGQLNRPLDAKQLTDLVPRDHQRSILLRTWLERFNPNLIGQDRLPVGARRTDRPPVPPWYRDWFENLLQDTLAPEVSPLPLNQKDWPLARGHYYRPQETVHGYITISPVPVPRVPTARRALPYPDTRHNLAQGGRHNVPDDKRSN